MSVFTDLIIWYSFRLNDEMFQFNTNSTFTDFMFHISKEELFQKVHQIKQITKTVIGTHIIIDCFNNNCFNQTRKTTIRKKCSLGWQKGADFLKELINELYLRRYFMHYYKENVHKIITYCKTVTIKNNEKQFGNYV